MDEADIDHRRDENEPENERRPVGRQPELPAGLRPGQHGRVHQVSRPQRYTFCPPASRQPLQPAGRARPDRAARLQARRQASGRRTGSTTSSTARLVVLYRSDSPGATDAGLQALPGLLRHVPDQPDLQVPAGSTLAGHRPVRRHAAAVRRAGLGPGAATLRHVGSGARRCSSTRPSPSGSTRRRRSWQPPEPQCAPRRQPSAGTVGSSAAPGRVRRRRRRRPVGRRAASPAGEPAARPRRRAERRRLARTGAFRTPGQDRLRRAELPRPRRRGRRPRRAGVAAAVLEVRERRHRRRRGDRPAGGHPRPRPRGRARRRHRHAGRGGSPRQTRWTTSPATSSSTTSPPATGRATRPRSREGQKGDGQWLRAKGSDTFLPMGPVFVPAGRARSGGRPAPPRAGGSPGPAGPAPASRS